MSQVVANLKVLKRWYLVPLKRSRIDSASSYLCFQNCGHVGSMMPAWWDWPKIKGFWNTIFHMRQKVTGLPIQKSPHVVMLNFLVPDAPKLVRFILIGTKLTIPWKQPQVFFTLVKIKTLLD